MAANYWIKLYHEILDDPKMGKLSDSLFRFTIQLFLVAGEIANEGEVLSEDDLAWRLRRSPDSIHEDLIELEKVGIMHRDGETWIVSNFAVRQAAVPDAERQRQKRKRDTKEKYYGHEDVTICDTDKIRIDKIRIDKIREEVDINDDGGAQNRPNIFKLYEQNIGTLAPLLIDELKEAEKQYPQDWIEAAFQTAVTADARNWRYIRAVLENRKAGKDKPKYNGNGRGKSKQATGVPTIEERKKYAEQLEEL